MTTVLGLGSSWDPGPTVLPHQFSQDTALTPRESFFVGGGMGATVKNDFEGDVRVVAIARGSPAEVAGLQLRDRVVAVNGTALNKHTTTVVARLIAETPPGFPIVVEIERRGAFRTVRVMNVSSVRRSLATPASLHAFSANDLDTGAPVSLSQFANQVTLVVNVASL